MYHVDRNLNKDMLDGINWSAEHWMNNREPGMIHTLEWLIEKFWPVPTWPEDWKEAYFNQ
jgi:hypothetical protein